MATNKDQVIIDLTGYKSKIGDRVAEARYKVIVDDAEKDRSSQGNDMINVWLRVVGGEHDGATIVDRLVLTEKSLFRVVMFMQALGLPTPKKRLQVNLRSWIGKALMIDVHDGEPYNGRVKSEVTGYERIRGDTGARSVPEASTRAVTPTDDLSGLEEFAPAPEASQEHPEAPQQEQVGQETSDAQASERAALSAEKDLSLGAAGLDEVDLDSLEL